MMRTAAFVAIAAVFAVVLSLAAPVVAQTPDLCSADWLDQATGADVQRLIQQGADPNIVCDGLARTRPLHQTTLSGSNVSREVVQALIDAGADVSADSTFGTPETLATERYEEAATAFQERRITLDVFQAWTAIYNAVRTAAEARSSALRNLCDSAWWRSASGESMAALLRSVGEFDPNRPCNSAGDTPLHIALRPVEPVTEDIKIAIATFIGNSTPDFQRRNTSNETPENLVDIRYDRLRSRMFRSLNAMCQNVTSESMARHNTTSDMLVHELDLYTGVKGAIGGIPLGVPPRAIMEQAYRDLYGHIPQGGLRAEQVCEHVREQGDVFR